MSLPTHDPTTITHLDAPLAGAPSDAQRVPADALSIRVRHAVRRLFGAPRSRAGRPPASGVARRRTMPRWVAADPERLDWLRARAAMAVQAQPALGSVRERLLQVGGVEVVLAHEIPFADDWLARAISYPVDGLELVGGAESACYENVARVARASAGRSVAVLGFAQSLDGLWRPHAWGWRDGRVIESTSPRVSYVGMPVSPTTLEALAGVQVGRDSRPG